MDSILPKLPRQVNPNVLIGFEHADDAGVYRVAPDLVLVQTVDFFTPIVDDPFTFGQIAAANSLSDIYAMGARPVSSLAITGFPSRGVPQSILEAILRGGMEKMQEADCVVIGGHTIGDDEIKFGYAVTGLASPDHILSNAGARAGDALLVTKRLGTGIIATALKREQASEAAVSEAVRSMLELNRTAAETLHRFRVHALTDVTGFGLLGHARELAVAGSVSLRLQATAFDLLPEAVAYANDGCLSGGLKNNREFLTGCVEFGSAVPEELHHLLFDPQTSGGLLISIAAEDADALAAALGERSVPAQRVGEVIPKTHPLLEVY